MMLALKIIGWWVLLSCTLGPCLTWLVFRRRRQTEAAFNHWIATHPDFSPEHMPREIAVNYFLQ